MKRGGAEEDFSTLASTLLDLCFLVTGLCRASKGSPEYRFSARNQLSGVVSGLVKGAVNCQVKVTLTGGALVNAMITNEAATELGLAEGVAVIALFKASHVLVGVPV